MKTLEKELLTQNAQHKDWACTEKLMKTTKEGKALYLHCLLADITGVNCETGEVDASVFNRYRIPLYKVQAAVEFASSKEGRSALITLLEKAKDGIAGNTGTTISQ